MPSGVAQPTARDYLLHGLFFNVYGWIKNLPSPLGDVLRRLCAAPFWRRAGRVRIYEGVKIWYPYRITIGDDTTLNEGVYLNGFGGLTIGSGVRIGHGTSILTSDHVIDDLSRPIHEAGLLAKAVTIGDDVFIGCKVTILGGVTVGSHAVIAAGAVVTRDVPEYGVAAGVPAKVIADRRGGATTPKSEPSPP
jgi:acetyltransferase-like isoleucine patch superfamily enzyme